MQGPSAMLMMGKTVIILMVILDYLYHFLVLIVIYSFDWSKEWGALGVAKGPKGLDAY